MYVFDVSVPINHKHTYVFVVQRSHTLYTFRSHLKILDASRKTWSTFHTQDFQYASTYEVSSPAALVPGMLVSLAQYLKSNDSKTEIKCRSNKGKNIFEYPTPTERHYMLAGNAGSSWWNRTNCHLSARNRKTYFNKCVYQFVVMFVYKHIQIGAEGRPRISTTSCDRLRK